MSASTTAPALRPDPSSEAGSTSSAAWHARTPEDVAADLGVSIDHGLSTDEVVKRHTSHGPNQLRAAHRRNRFWLALEQFRSVVILILIAAGALAFATGRLREGFAVAAVVLINATIGFVSEWRAVRSMEALRQLRHQSARVRRNGRPCSVRFDELVPGDVVRLETGDVVPADVRIVEAETLLAGEAALTGESMPVAKRTEAIDENRPLPERTSMLYKGTAVQQGQGLAVVVATGMNTELGRIARLAEEAESPDTPLEQRLDQLGRRLAVVTVAIAVAVAVAGLLAGRDPRIMIETALALGVAAIPEGLPIVATIALARGMWSMARRRTLINKLTAVETLGATRVIFTDKTGTLTENQMTLVRVRTAGRELERESIDDDPLARRTVELATLCNDAEIDADGGGRGDPTEVGILRGARIAGVDLGQLRARHPRERTHPFDPDVMMMATVHGDDGGHLAAVKGAPEAVIAAASHAAVTPDDDEPLDDQARASWRERVAALASEGLRVLAVADARMGSTDAEPYATLRLVGLVGLLDPARSDVRGAIEQCRSAGIRVVMVTGDQPETGLAIARHVGIATDDDRAMRGDELRDARQLTPEERERAASTVVFARVTPEQKLNLVEIAQGRGETVAMTGDGVNDAPALKKADIGIAMGKRGTEAARQASDMILQDDAFSSIVAAIHQGRIIFANIRASVMFMLCTNVAEILAVTAASLVNAPLPLHPLQILFLNVVTDVFPALALGVGKGGPHVMRRPPRPAAEAILTRGHWLGIGGWSVVIATSVLGALAYALIALELDAAAAVTISFLTLAFGKLWFVFNLRERRDGLLNNRITRNPWIWAAIALCSVLLLAAVYWPWLAGLLQTRPLDAAAWATVLTASAIPAAAGVALHILRRDRSAGGDRSDDRSAPVAAGDTV